MNSTSDKLLKAFGIADQLLQKLTIGAPDGAKPVISIEELHEVIATETGVTIEKYEAVFEAQHLRGRIERWDDGRLAKIHIRQDQPIDWKRFVTAKELIHIQIDEKFEFSPHGDETLDELVRKGHFGLASLPDLVGDPAQSEVLAEIAALEVLYPYQFREADVRALGDKEINRIQIAHRYGIPNRYAATAIDPAYLRELVKQIRGGQG